MVGFVSVTLVYETPDKGMKNKWILVKGGVPVSHLLGYMLTQELSEWDVRKNIIREDVQPYGKGNRLDEELQDGRAYFVVPRKGGNETFKRLEKIHSYG